jgi:hypothetical protein
MNKRNPMKPFDNETLRTKTTWTDQELTEELALLNAAIAVLDTMGDRYNVIVADLHSHKATRDNMARFRNMR